jgi:hypothetical protein
MTSGSTAGRRRNRPKTDVNWNQPVCDLDWLKMHPYKIPVRLMQPEQERCSRCGVMTRSGIYFRAHPDEVAFPKP